MGAFPLAIQELKTKDLPPFIAASAQGDLRLSLPWEPYRKERKADQVIAEKQARFDGRIFKAPVFLPPPGLA